MQIKYKYIVSSIFLIYGTFLYFCNILFYQIFKVCMYIKMTIAILNYDK